MGIEPTTSAWKAEVLPLNYTRILTCTGRSGRIRTCDPLLPRQVLYQTEPRPEYKEYYIVNQVKSQDFIRENAPDKRQALNFLFLFIFC